MRKTALDAIKEDTVKTERTAIVTIISPKPFVRRDLASVWCTEKELKKADFFEQTLIVNGKKGMVHGSWLLDLWALLPEQAKKNGTVRIATSQKFDFGKLQPHICHKNGYKKIRLEPTRTSTVRMVAITIETDNVKEYTSKRKTFTNTLRAKFPEIQYVVHCQKSGPCEIDELGEA